MQRLIASYVNADGDLTEVFINRDGKLVRRTWNTGQRAKALTPEELRDLDDDLNNGVCRWEIRPTAADFDLLIAARG